jgi:hypothetical protein
VSKFEDGCYGSLKGIALIAKVLAGRCQMHYTRVAAGKGTIPEDATPKELEQPPDYVMDAMISSVTNPVDGECQVSVQINSANVENGFYLTSLLLYAEDPDEGEVPFTYLSLENEPEWIRPSSSIVGKLAHFDMIAAVGDVDTVTATIDPDALVTLEEAKRLIAEHDTDPAAHPAIRALLPRQEDIVIPAEGWQQGGTEDVPANFFIDLPIEGVTESSAPWVSLGPKSTATAMQCGLDTCVCSLNGALRFFTKYVPEDDMPASLRLFFAGGSPALAPSGGITPATADRVGGVKVKPGSGLSVDSSGNLTLDTATGSEVAAIFNGSKAE